MISSHSPRRETTLSNKIEDAAIRSLRGKALLDAVTRYAEANPGHLDQYTYGLRYADGTMFGCLAFLTVALVDGPDSIDWVNLNDELGVRCQCGTCPTHVANGVQVSVRAMELLELDVMQSLNMFHPTQTPAGAREWAEEIYV